MAGHRNRLVENVIENNATSGEGAGIRIRGVVNDLEFSKNTIRDTRASGGRTQSVGIQIEEKVGQVTLIDNDVRAERKVVDLRPGKK